MTDVGNELITSNRAIDNIGIIAIDKFGNIYLADNSNHTIQKSHSNWKFITKWGSTGSGHAQFNGTLNIDTDPIANVYIFDGDNQSIQKFERAGKFLEGLDFSNIYNNIQFFDVSNTNPNITLL